MSLRIAASGLLILLGLSTSLSAADKRQARVERIIDLPSQSLGSIGSFAAAEACTAGNDSAIAYWIEGWVLGNELYKAYIDPATQCPSPYPFTVREINMPMKFDAAVSFTVSVDVESPDNSIPLCLYPGNTLAISSDWQIDVPGPGGYMIWIPLDTPIVVNGPFFAGFFLGSAIDIASNPSVYCDNDPRECFTYNIWDTTIGFVDLVNNSMFNFPGRLAMYVNGTTGGAGGTDCCDITPGTLLDFVTVPIGQFKDLMFTLNNCGGTTLNGTISETSPQYSLASGGGSFSLAPGQSRTVTVRFEPTIVGVYSCTIWTGLPQCSTVIATGVYGSSEPAPQIVLVNPNDGDLLMGSVDLWAAEILGSTIIDYVSFEYSGGGTFVEIGRDFDGTRPLRDGVTAAMAGSGYNWDWNFASLAEGTYTLRATVYDTLGRSAYATTTVYLEPTPPIPRIVSPANGDTLCLAETFVLQCSDEDMSNIQLYRSNALANYSIGLAAFDEHSVGDANGNPSDGNPAAAGEFGDYYSAPVAAAVAVKVWFDRNFTLTMREGAVQLSLVDVAERLATAFKTRTNKGTYDEDLLTGLTSYSLAHGDQLDFVYRRTPDYFELRTWAEEEQRSVILGLGGAPGLWVAVDGFTGWINPDSSYSVSIMNPISGAIETASMRLSLGASELYVNGSWHRVDIMVSMLAKAWTVNRTLVAADLSGADGWSINWPPTGLIEGSRYFFTAIGRDATSYRGSSTVLLEYSCLSQFAKGDYNGDGASDILDLYVLIDVIRHNGVAPVGGLGRADCNCDGYINIADMVYYINYLFGTSSSPCY
ncbi:MAG: dockerin type I domain-containing protein [Candidatus Zixiibacteriota bacterium]